MTWIGSFIGTCLILWFIVALVEASRQLAASRRTQDYLRKDRDQLWKQFRHMEERALDLAARLDRIKKECQP